MTTLSPEQQQWIGLKTACFTLFLGLQSIKTLCKITTVSYDECVTAFMYTNSKFDETPSPAQSGRSDQPVNTWISPSMSLLVKHLYDALTHEPEYFAPLAQIIAVAARHPDIWAHHFGQESRNSPEHHEAARQAAEPDCVLEVARRALVLADKLTPSATNAMLKVIANCCADMNENRELILQRQGLEPMLSAATHGIDLEILVPALFNVCSEYDQPPSYPESVARANTDSHPRPSYAAERLAGVYSSNANFTTFELLLSFSSKVSKQIKPYLSLLVKLATEPALDAFYHIRNKPDANSDPWTWSFSVNGKEHDTVALLLSLGQEDDECYSAIVQAGVCLLSQPEAQEGLLLRSDDAIWNVLTFACTADRYHDDDGEPIDANFEPARKVFLKHLYEMTSVPAFTQDTKRASIMISRSLSELTAHLDDNGLDQPIWVQAPAASSESFRIASACLVLSQLVSSAVIRDSLLEDMNLWKALTNLLQSEVSPDVLYPAVTIVSRTALSSRQQLPMVDSGILEAMQRLLTAGGLGMVVPFETVTAYKTICRGRPAVVLSLLSSRGRETTVAADILTLWDLTIDAATKLEIGKLFLEVFRTILPSVKEDENVRPDDNKAMAKQFEASLDNFADSIGMVFAWLCTSAEPQPQRDHGWFGLAMLSVWPCGRQSILRALERHDLGTVITEVSQLQDGPVPNNLKLMLSNIQRAVDVTVPSSSQQLLRQAAGNLRLQWPVQ